METVNDNVTSGVEIPADAVESLHEFYSGLEDAYQSDAEAQALEDAYWDQVYAQVQEQTEAESALVAEQTQLTFDNFLRGKV